MRRLHVLVDGLPPDAATWRTEARWSQAHELAAVQIETTDAWLRLVFSLLARRWMKKSDADGLMKAIGPPGRIPRPGAQPDAPAQPRPPSSPDEIKRFLKQ